MSAPGLLSLVQWLSPAFPLGSFAYSHGLETAIADGAVHSAATLQDWISTILRQGSGRMDAALLRAALAPEADHASLAAMAEALAISQERWAETSEQGAAFARTTTALLGQDMSPWPLPIAVGAAAQTLDAPTDQVIALYLQAFVSNLVSCGVRSVPLGQTEGQQIVAALAPLCQALAMDETPYPEIGSAAFGADLDALAHETAEVRLYRS